MKGKSPFERTKYGVGYKGILSNGQEPITSIHGKATREYRLWGSMMARCYSKNKYPNCTVCERWHCFANFLEDLPKIEGYKLWKENPTKRICLDKDLKQQNVDYKIYSIETCKFISNEENSRESAKRNGLGLDKTKTPIIAINLKTGEQFIFESQNEAARQLNCNQANIYRCLKGERKTTKGFSFKYL